MKKTNLIIFLALSILAQGQVRYQWIVDRVAQSPLVEASYAHFQAEVGALVAEPLLEQPEVEAAYFLGSPATIGNRWDVGVSQSFEFPTAYKHRKALRQLQANAAQNDFHSRRIALCREGQELCADLVYLNALVALHQHSLQQAQQMDSLYQRRLESGDCSLLDRNRVRIDLMERQKELRLAQVEQALLLNDLRTLCGDTSLVFSQCQYEPIRQGVDYMERLPRHPELVALALQQQEDSAQIALTRAHLLPSFSIAFAAENEVEEAFRGLKLGVTLPLWNRGKQVRAAQASLRASDMELSTATQRLLQHTQGLCSKLIALQESESELRTLVDITGGEALLKRAFQAGELPLEHYLSDLARYTDSRRSLLELQREMEHTLLELEEVFFYQ